MPLIDLPIEKLLVYPGTNPRPDDFDEYWNRGLIELDSVDPSPVFEAAEVGIRGAHTFTIWFNGVGGARIFAKALFPAWTDGRVPCIIHFHGYSMSSGDWMSLAAWTAAGYAVFAMDVRGQGGRSQDSGSVLGNTLEGHIIRGLADHPEKLLYRSIYLDCAQLARIALSDSRVDPTRVFAMGASQGGGLTLACAALEPRITKCAPLYPFLSDFKRVWDMDYARDSYGEIRQFFRKFDPRHEREDETWNALGYIDVQHLAPRIKAETLMFTGLMDTITPPSTQFAAYNKITASKRYCLYPDYAHEGLPEANDLTLRFFEER